MPSNPIIPLPLSRGSCHEVTEGGAKRGNVSIGSPLRALRAHLPRKRGEGALLCAMGVALSACGPQIAETSSLPESPIPVIESVTPPLPSMPKSLSLEDIDFNSFSRDLAKFTGLKEGQSRGEAVDNVRLYFAPESGSAIISTSQSKFEREDGAVLIFGASGLPDDSVKAEEIYLIVSGAKGSQSLAAFGSRIKCHRGENTTEWQTDLCP